MTADVYPVRWQAHAKTIVVIIGVTLSAIVVSVPVVPNWLLILTKVFTILGVHFQQNADLNGNGIPDSEE